MYISRKKGNGCQDRNNKYRIKKIKNKELIHRKKSIYAMQNEEKSQQSSVKF